MVGKETTLSSVDTLNFMGLLRHPRLSRVFMLRWSGQTIDGLFQSALASFLLFSPERQASALGAALAFAVLLLPYSLIGPFLGTVLDRISRQRTIFYANLIRCFDLFLIAFLVSQGRTGTELTVLVLLAFGVNRLILAGLSAGLPLLVSPESLITANAMAVTGGSLLVVLGGGIGFGLRKIFETMHNANHSDATIILCAAFGYLATAALALRIKRSEIGPGDGEKKSYAFNHGFMEMLEAFTFFKNHGDAARGAIATAIQRGGITALVLVALLLERNTFHLSNNPSAGLAGLAVTLSFAGVGIVAGALFAPLGVEKYGRHLWMRYMLFGSALAPLPLAIWHLPIPLYFAVFFTSLFGQSLKVTNDALVQSKIEDGFRGRIFAFYDVLVNGAIVLGALTTAMILPISGKSFLVPTAISIAYFLTGFIFLRRSRFTVPL